MKERHQLDSNLKRLKLPGILYSLDIRAKEAQENELGYIEFLSLLIEDEIMNRESNNLEKKIRQAGFSFGCTFEEFDFTFNKEALPSALVRDLATCQFVYRSRNLLISGPPGLGKSHVSQAIGYEACKRQMDVVFRKTSKLLDELSDPSYPKRAQRLLKRTLACHLLILDDFAFRKYSQKEAELIYCIADERLGKKATVLTSNRPPQDWYSIFPDPVIGGAILDRLVSGSIKIMATKGKSYRKENQELKNNIDSEMK